MIQGILVVFESEPEVVGTLYLTQIDGREILVVTELERAARTRIAKIANPCDEESRDSFIVLAVAIGTRNVQHLETEVAVLRVAIGADVLPRISGITVE